MTVEQYPVVVQFQKVVCIHKTDEGSPHDEVYWRIRTYSDPNDDTISETVVDTRSDPKDMNPDGSDGSVAYVDVSIPASGLHKIEFQLWDRDSKKDKGKDDDLGTLTITRDNATVSTDYICSSVYQPSGDRQAQYDVYWRVINKPVAAVRVLGIYCQKQSCGCNKDVIDKIANAASKAADEAADVIGEIETPKAELMSEAFKAAAKGIQVDAAVIEWLAGAIEGDDDVYLQHTDSASDNSTGGAFWPEGKTSQNMTDDTQITFLDSNKHYYRFPVDDQKTITIEVREYDPVKKDIHLGSLTINAAMYNAVNGKGAQVVVLSGSGNTTAGQEGAVYQLCYSASVEDFAYDATPDAQAKAKASQTSS